MLTQKISTRPWWYNGFSRVFPKIDHSARSDRIVLVEYTIGSLVELNTLSKVQKILPVLGKTENTAQSFIMGTYEKFFLGFLSVWKKLLVAASNTK